MSRLISETTVEEIKERGSEIVPSLLEEALKPVNKQPSYICPHCDHGRNGDGIAFIPNSPILKCFSCDYTGDIISLYQEIKSASFREAVADLSEMLNIEVEKVETEKNPMQAPKSHTTASRQESAQTPVKSTEVETTSITDYTDAYKEWQRRIEAAESVEYLQSRGISLLTAKEQGVGYNPASDPAESGYKAQRLIFPNTSGHYIAKAIQPVKSQYKDLNPKGSKAQPSNMKALYEGAHEAVFIVEGVMDALSIYEVTNEAEAISLNSVSNVNALVRQLEQKPTDKTLIISLDNDTAGTNASKKLTDALERTETRYKLVNVSGAYKDPNDHLRANREGFRAAIEEAIEKPLSNAMNERVNEGRIDLDEIGAFQDFIDKSMNKPVISTGFNMLNSVLDGGLHSGLHVIGAVSSLGKTTLVTQIADQVAANGTDVLIFSLEMSRYELMAKSVSRETYYRALDDPSNARTVNDILTGSRYKHFTERQLELIQEGIAAYAEYSNHLYIYEGENETSALDVDKLAREHRQVTGAKAVIIVDYLQILQPLDPHMTERIAVDTNVKILKQLSRDLDTAVIVVSSFNRENYSRAVGLTSFKESGGIEYSADVVAGLQFKAYSDTDPKNVDVNAERQRTPRQVEVKILKNRNGASGGSVSFNYYAKYNTFVEEDQSKQSKANRRK